MNIDIRCHDSRDYAMLRDMEGSDVGVLDASDRDCLDEIGALLVRRVAHHRLGIALLHRHFHVTDDEMLVETFNADDRRVEIRPFVHGAFHDDQIAPVTVRFTAVPGDAGRLDLIGMEYLHQSEENRCEAFDASDAACLADIRRILARRDKLDRFGVRLIHNPVNWRDDEVLFEESDVAGRVLSFEVGARGDPRVRKSVETFWVWDAVTTSSGDLIAVTHCPAKCKRFCQKTGLGHDPRGHDPQGHGPSTG